MVVARKISPKERSLAWPAPTTQAASFDLPTALDAIGESVEDTVVNLSNARRLTKLYTAGEVVYTDYLADSVNSLPVADTVSEIASEASQVATKLGLAAAGPVGLAVLGGLLGRQGAKELSQGVRERDATATLGGTRTLLLGAESTGVAVTSGASVVHNGLLSATTGVASAVILPIAIAHVGVDLAQGSVKTVKAIKTKDRHALVDGLATLGTGAAWATGLVAGPMVGIPLGLTFASVKFMNKRKAKKAARAALVERHQALPMLMADFARNGNSCQTSSVTG